jgi:hypothetical protein
MRVVYKSWENLPEDQEPKKTVSLKKVILIEDIKTRIIRELNSKLRDQQKEKE